MKLLTLNLLTCARKSCKSSPASFPLYPREAELEIVELAINVPFLTNMLRKLEWDAVLIIARELGMDSLLPASKPEASQLTEPQDDSTKSPEPTQLAKMLHRLLIETTIQEGKLLCSCCRHEYSVKEGIANFLLPAHMV